MANNIMTLRDLRLAVYNRLVQANLAFVGTDVFCSRAKKAWPQEKAFLNVYVQQSSFDDQDIRPEIYKVDTDVVIDVVVQESQTVDGVVYEIDDLFDLISNDVVNLFTSYPRPEWLIPGKIHICDFILKSFSDEINGDGETNKGARKITFTATWYFEPITRNDPINDLDSVHSEITVNL